MADISLGVGLKTKLKSRTTYDPVSTFGFALGYGGTQEQFYKKYGFDQGELDNVTGVFTTKSSNRKQAGIWLFKFCMETLIHEITHATLYVAEYLNVAANVESEFCPRYAEYLYREFMRLRK